MATPTVIQTPRFHPSGMLRALLCALLLALAPAHPAVASGLSQGDMDRLTVAVLGAARTAGNAPPSHVVQSRVQAVAEALRINLDVPGASGVLNALRQGDPKSAIDLLGHELTSRARKREDLQGAQAARVLLPLARLVGDAALERRAAEAVTLHDPEDLAGFGELARVLVQQGDLAAAEGAWQRILHRTSGDGEARYTALVPLLQLLEQRARDLRARQEALAPPSTANVANAVNPVNPANPKVAENNPYELAARMNDLAEIFADVRETSSAQGLYYRAVQVLETTRDHRAVGKQWETIAHFHEQTGDPARAVVAYQQAAALFEIAGEAEHARQLRDWLQKNYRMLPAPGTAPRK